MRHVLALGLLACSLVVANRASASNDTPPSAPTDAPAGADHGDLFPGAGAPTVSAATGLPFLGIAEVGMGVTNGFAVGAVGGVTPSVWTLGVRPRVRLATSEHTALVLNAPMLYYPKASAPGPGNIGATSWMLTRAELFFDGAASERWHVAGGMGFIAAASTEALGNFFAGKDFTMPAYNGSPESKRGFAGGIWNTVAARSSYAFTPRTHLFFEGTVVMQGIALAEGVGGPPFVVNVGAQHSF
jgi:hypothetical protein